MTKTTLVYNKRGIIILHGDAMSTVRKLKPVDLVFTSPPYNMRLRTRKGKYAVCADKHIKTKYEHFSDGLPIEEYYIYHRDMVTELLRVSPLVFIVVSFVTGSKEAWFRIMGYHRKQLRDVFIWDKGGIGQPAISEGVANRASEVILAFERSDTVGRKFETFSFAKGTLPDVWREGRGKTCTKLVRAVFPISLPLIALNAFGFRGCTILDPFMGSGTTLMAARSFGARGIGIEQSLEVAQAAHQCLEEKWGD